MPILYRPTLYPVERCDLTCGVSYRFRVSAHGDGSADKEAWSDTPGELTPGAAFCNGTLMFGSSSYSFI